MFSVVICWVNPASSGIFCNLNGIGLKVFVLKSKVVKHKQEEFSGKSMSMQCVYVCVCECMYMCMCLCECLHVFVGVYLHVFVGVCLHVFVGVYLHVFVGVCLHVFVGVCLHVFVGVCLCACVLRVFFRVYCVCACVCVCRDESRGIRIRGGSRGEGLTLVLYL